MPINCLVNSEQFVFKQSIHGQFVNNSWTFMFQKDDLSSFALCLFLSFPLSSSFLLFPPLSSSLPPLLSSLFLSLPLSSSLFLSFPPLLSFFNVRPAHVANFLKTRNLRKRHFWLQIFESREAAKNQNVRCKNSPIIRPLPRRPYTPQAAETAPTCSAAKPCTM